MIKLLTQVRKIPRLTISDPDIRVHRIIPQVIINTDMYLDKVYRLPRMIIPMTILAIREPWKNEI